MMVSSYTPWVVIVNNPYGVCVSSQYVYVGNAGGHNVSAFTTAAGGHPVTSFGQYGGEEGEFKDPCVICVDNHFIVYECDYVNYRVQCY